MIALQRISSLGVLAGGVFHELNNALTPILNYAKLGLRNPDPAYRERALTQIVEAAQRAATITRGMLGLSRPGNIKHREPTDLARLVEEVVMLVKKDMARHRVRLDVKATGQPVRAGQPGPDPAGAAQPLDQRPPGDARRGEWCGCAWGWTPPAGWPRSAWPTPASASRRRDLRRIFEPFFSTKTEPDAAGQGGTGLGLAVCRDIVEAHHGRLRAESRLGPGFDVHHHPARLPAAGDGLRRPAAGLTRNRRHLLSQRLLQLPTCESNPARFPRSPACSHLACLAIRAPKMRDSLAPLQAHLYRWRAREKAAGDLD